MKADREREREMLMHRGTYWNNLRDFLGFMCNSQLSLSFPQIFIIAHFSLDVSSSSVTLYDTMNDRPFKSMSCELLVYLFIYEIKISLRIC